MPKLTPEQRRERRENVQREALEAVAARGQFNFRLDGNDIKRLHTLAAERAMPVSKMVREWVLERLDAEEKKDFSSPLWAQALAERLKHTELTEKFLLLSAASSSEMPEAIRNKVKAHLQNSYGDYDEDLQGLV